MLKVISPRNLETFTRIVVRVNGMLLDVVVVVVVVIVVVVVVVVCAHH